MSLNLEIVHVLDEKKGTISDFLQVRDIGFVAKSVFIWCETLLRFHSNTVRQITEGNNKFIPKIDWKVGCKMHGSGTTHEGVMDSFNVAVLSGGVWGHELVLGAARKEPIFHHR
jgi:hypothetical protein